MIVVIDYELGNLASVTNALEKLEIPFEISSNIDMIKKAKALILPGVGAAKMGMLNLKKKKLDQLIIDQVKNGKPILGICLGMQLLFTSSEEGNVNCLDLIKGKVKKFKNNLKVPQIGWNQVKNQKSKIKNQKLFKSIPDNSYFYFVNSYFCEPVDQNVVLGATDYGQQFCSILKQDNIYGVQFHPEKSSDAGFQFLRNFWEDVC